MASRLLSNFKQRLGSLELEPSGGGCFELTVGDKLVYSKLQTGIFPDEDTVLEEVGKLVLRHS